MPRATGDMRGRPRGGRSVRVRRLSSSSENIHSSDARERQNYTQDGLSASDSDSEDNGARLIPSIEYSRGGSTVDEDLQGTDIVSSTAYPSAAPLTSALIRTGDVQGHARGAGPNARGSRGRGRFRGLEDGRARYQERTRGRDRYQEHANGRDPYQEHTHARGRGRGRGKTNRHGRGIRSKKALPPLAEGWYEAWDKNQGRLYYFRYDPDQSVWDRKLATLPEGMDVAPTVSRVDEARGRSPPRYETQASSPAPSQVPGWTAYGFGQLDSSRSQTGPALEASSAVEPARQAPAGSAVSGSAFASGIGQGTTQGVAAPSQGERTAHPPLAQVSPDDSRPRPVRALRADFYGRETAGFAPGIGQGAAAPTQGERTEHPPLAQVSLDDFRPRPIRRLGPRGDSALRAGLLGRETLGEVRRNVARFLHEQRLRYGDNRSSTLGWNDILQEQEDMANGWVAHYQEVLPYAPLSSEGVVNLIRLRELEFQNTINEPREVRNERLEAQLASAGRPDPLQLEATTEDPAEPVGSAISNRQVATVLWFFFMAGFHSGGSRLWAAHMSE